MSERDTYPAGVPCWVDTLQPDPDQATHFYGQLFGWEFGEPGPMSNEAPGRYFVARLRGRDVAGVGSLPPGAVPGWNTYIAVDSVDAAAATAREAGGEVLVEPFDAMPAGRAAVLRDPSGAPFCLWEAGARQGAQVINEPSAWAMSALHTGDPDACRAFYAAAFGWETEPFGDQATLWRLPGYVGGEPQQPVPRDVVAVMAPLPEGAPPHWGVDFWIADADAAATLTERQGGRVVVAPHEAGPFRSGALADPAGAVFSVSQLLLR